MTGPTVPVTQPANEQEMVDYIVFNVLFHGMNFFDSDEYIDVEVDYAVESGYTLEEYEQEDGDNRWTKHINGLIRAAHHGLVDHHNKMARELT